jgi:hypothetical protein
MGYWEKLDVEDRHGGWLKPAAWTVCAIGGTAVY